MTTPHQTPPPPTPAVVSCHGGSGATTLARLLGWREVQRDQLAVGAAPLVLVARGTAYGLHFAIQGTACAHDHIAHGWLADRPILAIVADSPAREPSTVRARTRLLEDRVRGVVHVPYMSDWRGVDDPLTVPPTKQLASALNELTSLLSPALSLTPGGAR